MFTFVFILSGAVLGYVTAALFFGPNETGSALGGRLAMGIIGGLVGLWASSLAGGRVPIAWAAEVTQVKSSKRFEELLEASKEKPVLVEFYANWCIPCRRSASHLNALAKEGRAVAVVNIDEQAGLVRRYSIMGVPTTFVLYGGEVQGEVSGYLAEEEMREMMESVLPKSA